MDKKETVDILLLKLTPREEYIARLIFGIGTRQRTTRELSEELKTRPQSVTRVIRKIKFKLKY